MSETATFAELNAFLEALAGSNEKAWFEANRDWYERAYLVPGKACAGALAEALQSATGLALKGRVRRIHRDTRFAKDKTPYKDHVHLSAELEEATRDLPLGFQVRVSPGDFGVAAGAMGFGKDALAKWRAAVAGDAGAELASTIETLTAAGYGVSEPELKRVPRGFDADHPRADLLRRKGLFVHKVATETGPVEVEAGAAAAVMAEALAPLALVVTWLRTHSS